jgi:hypothetical protein
MPVVGFPATNPPMMTKIVTVPFLQGLKETGFVEGQRDRRRIGTNRSVVRFLLDEYRREKFSPPRNPRIAA